MRNLLILLSIVTLFSCGKNSEITGKKTSEDKKSDDKKEITTDKKENSPDKKSPGDIQYTVITAGERLEYVFGKDYKSWIPSDDDISWGFKKIDTCFYDQKRGTVNRLLNMKPGDYCMQFVGAMNSKGERMLWVNCFCKSQVEIFKNWKDDLVEVEDGGKCFFNVRFNLDRPDEPYVLKVNGNA